MQRDTPFRLGDWLVEPDTGRLSRGGSPAASLEPRLMSLLVYLSTNAGRVLPRATLEADVWSGRVVGDDTVARAVSRLRRALGDDAQNPRYIETLPRRGYRLIAEVGEADRSTASTPHRASRWLAPAAALLIIAAGALVFHWGKAPAVHEDVSRADDLYMRFTRADNEAAIGLYERVLESSPDDARAMGGLANALVQRVIRWPEDSQQGARTLADALARGQHKRETAQATLTRALRLARRAAAAAPNDPDALKPLAFALTASGDLAAGASQYEAILQIDEAHWPSLINLGEIRSIEGDELAALAYLERAWAAMQAAYNDEPQRVGPWQLGMGVIIAERYGERGDPREAERWYRRALKVAPYAPQATVPLAQLLADRGELEAARDLCATLRARLGANQRCLESN
ncbi:MAG: winged helix-turn-helix domain-containing protein [Pseudomonadota bacterium]